MNRLLNTVLLLSIVFNTSLKSQIPDVEIITEIYHQWEKTIKDKQSNEHLELYLYPQASVYIIRKSPAGANVLATINVTNFINSFSQPTPYQLDISDIQIRVDSNFAITDARFDEFYNNSFEGFGRDLFAYVKTNAGWKLLLLHNTFVVASDTTDYTIPFTLSNSVENVLDGFTAYYNGKNGTGLSLLFVSNQNPVIVFSDVLDSNFQIQGNRVLELSQSIHNSAQNRVLQLSNINIQYVDHYFASVFCDYEITLDSQLSESGRAFFSLMGDVTNGWRLTSFLRNNMSIQTNMDLDTELNQTNITVYPNPTREVCDIIVSGVDDLKYRIEIFNQLGQISNVEAVMVSEHHYTINLRNHPPGIYNARVSGGLRSHSQKIILIN